MIYMFLLLHYASHSSEWSEWVGRYAFMHLGMCGSGLVSMLIEHVYILF